MSKRRRKSVYIQPPHEVNSKKERTPTTRKKSGPARPAQEIPVPSVKRTAKMLPIYFIVMFGLQYLLTGSQGLSTTARLLNSLLIASMVSMIFFPVLHMMEKSRYRRMMRMKDRAGGKGSSGKADGGRTGSKRTVKG